MKNIVSHETEGKCDMNENHIFFLYYVKKKMKLELRPSEGRDVVMRQY